ncbi:calmegin isoform X1 [Sphaerodactylus townsendi]|uniref:calmegin isoform X1 n=2 Tax=Sphaerodactylus townsendi TaxID=933632 RepID=UPI002026A96E|nr:calmegin isoform X1 [Sphaerodactylus townsendi]
MVPGMQFQWDWLCFSVLLFSAVGAESQASEVEVEDFDKNSENANVDKGAPTLEVVYKTPMPTGEVYFTETFDDGILSGWVLSQTKKEDTDEDIAKYDGRWEIEPLKENMVPGDRGLVLKSVAKHHAISAMLTQPFIFDSKPLIIQYEVNFQNGIDCGGAYVKLLSKSDDLNLEYLYDKTSYTIMFGPDKCGEDYKLHFIFRHKHPKTGDYDEKHAKRPDVDLKKFYTDKKTHLYTLVLKPDNTFEVSIDQTVVGKGSLLEDMVPPVNPPEKIDDPNDKKPEDWDERAKISDPNAVKPEDWNEDEPPNIEDPDAVKPDDWLDDEPEYIPDPSAKKPEDWDEEMDGEWEAPQIPNPKCDKSVSGCGEWVRPLISNPNYKGKWKPPMMDNPNYQGIWNPQKIPNPDYFEDPHPFRMTPVSAVGLELWSMTSDIYFDNFIICSDKEVADRWAADGWGIKKLVASANEPGMFSQLITAAEERPWLWILYVLTLALPVGLGILFCWPAKKIDEDLEYKKTDVAKPITKGELEQEIQGQDEELEGPNDNAGDGDEGGENEDSDEENDIAQGNCEEESNKSNKSGSEDEMKEADESTGSGDGPAKSVRKRRVRKD